MQYLCGSDGVVTFNSTLIKRALDFLGPEVGANRRVVIGGCNEIFNRFF